MTGDSTSAAATITTTNNDNIEEQEQVTILEEMGFLTNRDAPAVAAHAIAILDAGIFPLLLCIRKHKVDAAMVATLKNIIVQLAIALVDFFTVDNQIWHRMWHCTHWCIWRVPGKSGGYWEKTIVDAWRCW